MSGQALFYALEGLWWRAHLLCEHHSQARSHKWPDTADAVPFLLSLAQRKYWWVYLTPKILKILFTNFLWLVYYNRWEAAKTMSGIVLMLFCNFSDIFFTISSWLCLVISCLHRHEPFQQNWGSGIKADSISSVIILAMSLRDCWRNVFSGHLLSGLYWSLHLITSSWIQSTAPESVLKD